MNGVEAVLLPEPLRRVVDRLGLAHAGLDVQHPRFFCNELERILVPGGDDAGVPRFFARSRHAAQQVVGLKALLLHAEDPHGVQNVLEDGHLHGQLLRHALALGLVALVLQMPEGGGFQVEGHGDPVGLFNVQQPLQDGQKAVDRVGGGAVRGVQHADAEKRPVDDAVSVDG